jgi:hypothetical protein
MFSGITSPIDKQSSKAGVSVLAPETGIEPPERIAVQPLKATLD